MIEEARRKIPPELEGRVRFEVADASRLPYSDGSFALVALMNMIPFFDELARVTAPGGAALFSFSGGAGTPIYVPPDRLRAELARRGFAEFADFAAGNGTVHRCPQGRPRLGSNHQGVRGADAPARTLSTGRLTGRPVL